MLIVLDDGAAVREQDLLQTYLRVDPEGVIRRDEIPLLTEFEQCWAGRIR